MNKNKILQSHSELLEVLLAQVDQELAVVTGLTVEDRVKLTRRVQAALRDEADRYLERVQRILDSEVEAPAPAPEPTDRGGKKKTAPSAAAKKG